MKRKQATLKTRKSLTGPFRRKKDDDDDPVLLLALNSETSIPWDELEVKVSDAVFGVSSVC